PLHRGADEARLALRLRISGEPSGSTAARPFDVGTDARPACSWRNTIIDLPAKEGPMTPNIADIIRHHVSLEVRCLDRLYLHASMPKRQTSGGLCSFLRDHLGNPIPSPALFKPMHDRFVTAVERFVSRHAIPVVHFDPGQDKDAIATAHRAHFTAREGVVMLGIAQEKMRAFKAHKQLGPGVKVRFEVSRQWVAVNQYYF